MDWKNRCSGMVMPLSLLAIIAVLGLVMTMGGLNQGVRTQIYRTNNHQLSFLIAYSAFSRVCAKIHSFSWANRPFRDEPYTESHMPLGGGHYDLLVENTVGQDYQADIYIKTSLAGISRLYFWRIRFNDDLLDISNNIIVELYTSAPPEEFPTVSGSRVIAGKVADLLSERKDNQEKSDALAAELVAVTSPAAIIEKLNGRVPDNFEQDWPMKPQEETMSNKIPVSPPDLSLPLVEEKPTAPGPNPMRTIIGYDSMTGNRIDELSDKLTEASGQLVESTDKAWDEIDNNGVAGIPAAEEHWETAAEAKEDTYNTLDQLIDETEDGIAEAPSFAAQEAIETMVSQTVVSSMNDIATSIDRGYEHLETGGGSYLEGLPTSADVENLLNDWKAAEERTQGDLDQLKELSKEIDGYSMSTEVTQQMADCLASVEESLTKIQDAVAAAEARLAELLELEAQQAAAENEETQP